MANVSFGTAPNYYENKRPNKESLLLSMQYLSMPLVRLSELGKTRIFSSPTMSERRC